MSSPVSGDIPLRTDLGITSNLGHRYPAKELATQIARLAAELHAPILPRLGQGLPKLFARYPEIQRILIVQKDRLLLVGRNGEELFYHPNTAYLRLQTILRGGRDLLLDAADLQAGDSVLDTTLGYAAEAILCAHAVGETGEVHGIEAVPELGVVVREGLQTVVTEGDAINAAMRRVKVVHIGHHLDFLRACPSRRYDVVCFDPFFGEILHGSSTFDSIRAFGEHAPLLPEALREAQRVARRKVLVKAVKWSETLADFGITASVRSRSGKVVFGVLPAL